MPSLATSVSRRRFLAGTALAAPATLLGSSISTPASAAGLPLVTPVWSEAVRQSYGVCAMLMRPTTGYGYVDAWSQSIADLGAGYIRARYWPGGKSNAAAIAACRRLGLKWLMLILPEDWQMTTSSLTSILTHIRNNAADICIGIEGINEPNHNRDGTPVRPDWAQATVAYQRTIKEFVASSPSMSHVTVVGPSLQLGGSDPYRDFVALTNAGVLPYMDMAGLHSYPGGFKPDNSLDKRLGWVRDAWGPIPSWGSETGFHTAMSTTSGHRPAPPDVAATYGPRSVLDFFSRGARSARFEILDDPNPANDDVEANFGLLECSGYAPSTWTPKPEYTVMQHFLHSLKDSAPAYTPKPVPLAVTAPSTVKWTVVGKSDGTRTLLAYQNVNVYDAIKKVRLTVNPVDVKVTDPLGSRIIKVGGEVTSLPLR